MGSCEIAIFIGDTKSVYTCDEIRNNLENMKSHFRKTNNTEHIWNSGSMDTAYENYCEQFNNFLNNCKCNPESLKCEKCSEDDHEGYFCRCEGRNIRLARQLREKGLSPWQKDNKAELFYGPLSVKKTVND